MSFQSILLFFFDYKTILISLIISYIIYQLFKLYQKVWTLPPGPIPLPFIGNILIFRSKHTWDKVLTRYSKIYGPVFTIWLGPFPMVFISDADIGRDVFSKIEFAGRHENFINRIFYKKHKGVALSSGEVWVVLRKVTHSAIMKYSKNKGLCLLTSDCVENTINKIISREGVEQEFSSYEYINSLVINIMANSVFGERNGAPNKIMKFINSLLHGESKYKVILCAFSPLFRIIGRKIVKNIEKSFEEIFSFSKEVLRNHYKDYDESIERDFCDALINAKKEALREGKQSLKHMTDDNLAMVLFEVSIAGTVTTVDTLQWIILFMTYYPEFQQKIRQEIENQIGNRIPTHEDRNRCHFVMAFISETLRMRNVVPGGVPHSTIVPAKIGDYMIPKGTGLMVFQDMILTDEKHWQNAQEFRPQRFLDNGVYISRRPKAYIPFGTGRRVCPGEKLALADIFLIIVRFLQLSNEYNLVLGSNCGVEPDPYFDAERPPAKFKILLRKIK